MRQPAICLPRVRRNAITRPRPVAALRQGRSAGLVTFQRRSHTS
jgi:hypothetical protein